MQDHPDVVGSLTEERLEHTDTADFPDDPCAFYFRKMSSGERPGWLFRDVSEFATLPLILLAANILPARMLTKICDIIGALYQRIKGHNASDELRPGYTGILNDLDEDEWLNLRTKQVGQKLARRFAIAREFRRRRTDPVMDVQGVEPLQAALSKGKGAILWVNRFNHYAVFSKKALFEEGILGFGVSNSAHGYTHSRLAEHTINKIHVAAENQYLAKRLVFADGEETKLQKMAVTALKAGHPVIYTNSDSRGNRYVKLPLGSSGTIQMATGPISMALRMGIPLFSVSVFEVEPFTRYTAEIKLLTDENPQAPKRSKSRVDYEAMAKVARLSRDEMLAGIRRFPEQSENII